jgi:hypothetical protein
MKMFLSAPSDAISLYSVTFALFDSLNQVPTFVSPWAKKAAYGTRHIFLLFPIILKQHHISFIQYKTGVNHWPKLGNRSDEAMR